jgi:PhnB protein
MKFQRGAANVPVNPIPRDYLATPYLICRNAAAALDWYIRALRATEVVRLADDSGKVMHAEIRIGRSPIMLADEFPDMGYISPDALGGSPVSILVYVENVDAAFAHALSLGAKQLLAVANQFDGERRGTLRDPHGHVWLLSSRSEEITKPEMKLRFENWLRGAGTQNEG